MQFILTESCFVPELRFGCVWIENADQLPLDMANFTKGSGQVTLALDGATGKPGTADSFVAINTFQFPAGASEFKRVVEWFGQDRRSRAKLPDGIKFDDSVLAVRDAPSDWEHEAYPQSNRAFVHIYRGTEQAILVRWIARSGTILDHALFKPLLDNLRIVPGQWITEVPSIQAKLEKRWGIKGTPLTEEMRIELDASAVRARDVLRIGHVDKPRKIAEAIRDAIEELRNRKTKKADKVQFVTDCGALWGQALCEATGWVWQRLENERDDAVYAVCSPNGSHAVLPFKVIFELVTYPKSEDNSLLLFNMIVSGNVPASTEGAFSLLQ